MAIVMLSKDDFDVGFIGETILLRVESGKLLTSEVYDIFLHPRRPYDGAKLLCVSSDDLLTGTSLGVSFEQTPGLDERADRVYSEVSGARTEMDVSTNRFTAVLAPFGPNEAPGRSVFSGQVLVPTAQLPWFVEEAASREIMKVIGTVFELDLGRLSGGDVYFMRLITHPTRQLGWSQSRPLKYRSTGHSIVCWSQEIVIWGPRTLLHNFVQLCREAKATPETARAAAEMAGAVVSPAYRPLLPDRHRIVLCVPEDGDLTNEHCVGTCWFAGRQYDPKLGLIAEWASGRDVYWSDDPECMATRIHDYLKRWARGEPKSKEMVSAALNADHENCSLIVDAMTRVGVVKFGGPGLYSAADIPERELADAMRSLASEREVIEGFKWAGYEIRATVEYACIAPLGRLVAWSGPLIAVVLAALALLSSVLVLLLHLLSAGW